MTTKEPIRFISDHLQANSRRKCGTQNGGLVPCTENSLHGHHPKNEWCPECLNYLEMLEERSRKEVKIAKAAKAKVDPLGVTGGYEYTVDNLRRSMNTTPQRRSAGQKLYEQTVTPGIASIYPWATKVPPSVQQTWESRALKMGILPD